jgi:hypothetical protein
MADLPNINTADVGIIAFWNAEDHKTAGVVDPLDCTGVFDSYDVYDNGLDGYITLGSGRNFNCRVKNDGWCVAWIDRTNTFAYPANVAADFGESGYKGYYDILWNWIPPNANTSATLTTLSYIISLLEAALETSGNFTFAAADVGHYCYEFPAANVLTTLSSQYDTGGGHKYSYIQYTAGTTLHYAAVCGTRDTWKEVLFAGNLIAYHDNSDDRMGVADIIAENWMPDALTDYALSLSEHGMGGVHGSILILWS